MNIQAVTSMSSPCDWEQDLVWRMSRAKPEDTLRGLCFNATLEAVRKLGGDDAVRRCQGAGGEERFLDFFNYPVRSLLKMVYFAVEMLGPAFGGGDEVLRLLGRQTNADFLASPVGRAAKVVARGNLRRMMESAPEIYRQTVGFGSLAVEWTGARSGRMVRRGDFLPPSCHEGALEDLLRSMGGRRVRVANEWVDGLDGGFTFSWE